MTNQTDSTSYTNGMTVFFNPDGTERYRMHDASTWGVNTEYRPKGTYVHFSQRCGNCGSWRGTLSPDGKWATGDGTCVLQPTMQIGRREYWCPDWKLPDWIEKNILEQARDIFWTLSKIGDSTNQRNLE